MRGRAHAAASAGAPEAQRRHARPRPRLARELRACRPCLRLGVVAPRRRRPTAPRAPPGARRLLLRAGEGAGDGRRAACASVTGIAASGRAPPRPARRPSRSPSCASAASASCTAFLAAFSSVELEGDQRSNRLSSSSCALSERSLSNCHACAERAVLEGVREARRRLRIGRRPHRQAHHLGVEQHLLALRREQELDEGLGAGFVGRIATIAIFAGTSVVTVG